MGDLSWRDRAACKGVDTKIFFPHDTLRQTRWDEGLAYCYACTVRLPCLDLALQHDSVDDRWGLFGGLLPGERRAMRRGYGNFERQYADGTIVGVRTTRNG
jgi:hypothetical protein